MTEGLPQPSRPDAPWYAEGLRFSCTRCGGCCTGAPGYVWVAQDEMEAMAVALGISLEEFARRYCRRVWRRISLRELPNFDCVFLGAEGCRVYPVRPRQCRTFPFWTSNLHNRRSWERLRAKCPGVDKGRHYGLAEIIRISQSAGAT